MIGRQNWNQQRLFIVGDIRQFMPNDHILHRADRIADRNLLRDGANIGRGRLCVNVNIGARYGQGRRGKKYAALLNILRRGGQSDMRCYVNRQACFCAQPS